MHLEQLLERCDVRAKACFLAGARDTARQPFRAAHRGDIAHANTCRSTKGSSATLTFNDSVRNSSATSREMLVRLKMIIA